MHVVSLILTPLHKKASNFSASALTSYLSLFATTIFKLRHGFLYLRDPNTCQRQGNNHLVVKHLPSIAAHCAAVYHYEQIVIHATLLAATGYADRLQAYLAAVKKYALSEQEPGCLEYRVLRSFVTKGGEITAFPVNTLQGIR